MRAFSLYYANITLYYTVNQSTAFYVCIALARYRLRNTQDVT